MKLKINLSIMTILSFILLQQVTATANEPSVDTNNKRISVDTPPIDILFIIDNSKSMETVTEPPISPENRKSWEEFRQTVANMEFDKPGIRIRFSLDENKQLRCFHSMMHNSVTNCTDIVN